MRVKRSALALMVALLGLAFAQPCLTSPTPVVAVVDFENTTARYGTNVTGVEEAATARLITLLKESGCYEVVERSELVNIMMRQGLESMAPEALAKAAGAGYVVVGTVTRVTIAEPSVVILGVRVGETRADVEMDVRVTDIITGRVLVSQMGRGSAGQANLSLRNLPMGGFSFNDPNVGPLVARAADDALRAAVEFIRKAF